MHGARQAARHKYAKVVWVLVLLLANLLVGIGAPQVSATTGTLSLAAVDSTSTTVLSAAEITTDTLRESLYWGDVGEPGGLGINEVIGIARKHNPNWRTFAANHAAAHAELLKAVAYPNPEFEVEAGRAKAREKDDEGLRPSRGTLALGFSQPIEMPGKRLARRVEAEAGIAVANAEVVEFDSALRADVIEAYYTVQYHAALERLWQSLLEVGNELLGVADSRVKLGEAISLEQVNARVEVLKATRERDASRRRTLGARAALNALTGGALGTKFKLSKGLPSDLPSRSIGKSVDTALGRHPRLLTLKADLERKYASIDRERTAWWPDVKVGVTNAREFDAIGTAVTAGVTIPLWDRNRGGVAAAEAAAQKTYGDIIIACNEIRRDVEVAYQNYEVSRAQMRSYDDGLRAAAEEALEMAATLYREGAAGYLDVLTARRLLQETEQGYIQSRFDAAIALAQMDRAVGVAMADPRARK